MKTNSKYPIIGLLVIVLVLGIAGIAMATTANDGGVTATVDVPAFLEITHGTAAVTLQFTSGQFSSGAVSTTPSVTYTIRGNNVDNAALTGFVTGAIDSTVDGIALKADPNASGFTQSGQAGDIAASDLADSSAGYITLGTSAANLVNKSLTTGAQKMVIDGTMDVTYQAVLTRDHESVNTSRTITLTVKDI